MIINKLDTKPELTDKFLEYVTEITSGTETKMKLTVIAKYLYLKN